MSLLASLPVLGLLTMAAHVRPAGDLDATEVAFLEIRTAHTRLYVEERITVQLVFGLDREFLRDSLVPMFRRDLDLPVQLVTGWSELERAHRIAADVDAQEGRRFALDGEVARARPLPDERRGDRVFAVLEHTLVLRATEEGPLRIPAASLHFAYATQFRDDFLGRVPLDRHEATLTSEPCELLIQALPVEGRPVGFTGAVGHFRVRAEVPSRTLDADESLRVTLVVEGRGNLELFEPPRLESLAGWHVLGYLDDRGRPVRRIDYDLVPATSGVTELPPMKLRFFDPTPPAAYRTVATAPVPIEVMGASDLLPTPAPVASTAAPRPGLTADDVPAPTPLRGWLPAPTLALTALVLAALAALGYSATDPRETGSEPGVHPGLGAADHFRTCLAEPGSDPARALEQFLARHLGWPPAAVTATDLAERLGRAGIPGDLAAEVAALHEALVAGRYGGPPVPEGSTRTRKLVDQLDPVLREMARRSPSPAHRDSAAR